MPWKFEIIGPSPREIPYIAIQVGLELADLDFELAKKHGYEGPITLENGNEYEIRLEYKDAVAKD